jgi:hypothetical protein
LRSCRAARSGGSRSLTQSSRMSSEGGGCTVSRTSSTRCDELWADKKSKDRFLRRDGRCSDFASAPSSNHMRARREFSLARLEVAYGGYWWGKSDDSAPLNIEISYMRLYSWFQFKNRRKCGTATEMGPGPDWMQITWRLALSPSFYPGNRELDFEIFTTRTTTTSLLPPPLQSSSLNQTSITPRQSCDVEAPSAPTGTPSQTSV